MRFDGDSAVMVSNVDGGGFYAVSRSVVTRAGWGWDSHLEAIRRVEGRHSVDVTETGLCIRWRNPGDYKGRHRPSDVTEQLTTTVEAVLARGNS